MRILVTLGMGLLLVGFVIMGCDDDTTEPPYDVTVNPADFVAQIDNPYLPLTPGTVFFYDGTGDGGHETNTVTVTNQTYVVLGVTCTVVEDTVLVDGELLEATTDWYAQDTDGNVWYFGEASRDFENGVIVSTGGSWEAGQRGAQPGIVMLADPRVGQSYRQEYEPGVAEDRARVISRSVSVSVPYGSFTNCVQTEEWTDLEPGVVEYKTYASGVGVVSEVTLVGGNDSSKLVSITGTLSRQRN
jgi:hypothetical protein